MPLRWGNVMNTTGIKNSWSLVAFAQSHGKMRVGTCTNQSTGEQFQACAFTAPDNTRLFVSFSRNLGEMSAKEIAEQKDSLQVVECTTKEGATMYSLCRQGNGDLWGDEVEL